MVKNPPANTGDLRDLVVYSVKNLPTVQETWVRSLGWEDSMGRYDNPSQYSCLGESHAWA